MTAFALTANTKFPQRKYAFGNDRHLSMCVYSITNNENGHQYIGVTSDKAGSRWRNHVQSSEKSGKACPLVARAIKKYGVENFSFEVIDIAESREQLSHKEKFWISKMNSLAPNGYNLTTGGDATFEIADAVREKLRAAAKKRDTPELRKWNSDHRRAWFAADPQRRIDMAERARRIHTGRKQSAYQIEARAAGKRGMVLTHEQRITLARAHMQGRIICCSNGERYLSAYEAAIVTGADKDKIGNVCTGKRKSTRGLMFWYAEFSK